MKSKIPVSNALAGPIATLALSEGPNATRHEGVTAYRVTSSQPPIPTLYDASVIIVGQGIKRGYLGNTVYEYDAGNYLVMTSPLPMLCEIVASAGCPVLTVAIEIDMALLGELVLEINDATPLPPCRAQRGVCAAPLSDAIESAAVRLLHYLADDCSTRVLARQTIREILFHVLHGPHGNALRSLALANSRAGQLSRVIRHMHRCFAQPMKIQDLARMAHMSVPSFHENFRVFTSMSPLQYLKAVRLTKSRLLMLQSGLPPSAAARTVGYESASQFSREFRRFFGAPPLAEIMKSRATLAGEGVTV